MISDAPVLRLRDRLLPLVSLGNLLKLRKKTVHEEVEDLIDAHDGVASGSNGALANQSDATANSDGDGAETFIVVTQVGTYTFGIIVDRVFDTEEIVVKPVAPILRHISMFSGNTILGDGSVIMILDPNGIATATGEVTMGTGTTTETTAQHDARADDRTSLLVFRAGGKDLKAVPLALVARLEEVDCATVEHSYGKPVVQYRGQLMPLVTVYQGYEIPEDGASRCWFSLTATVVWAWLSMKSSISSRTALKWN